LGSIKALKRCSIVSVVIVKEWMSMMFWSSKNKPGPLWSTLQINTRLENTWKSRDSSVGIALGYGLDDRGSRIRFPAGARNFSLHHLVQNGSGAHPASSAKGALSPGPVREADLLPPSNAEVKNA
jgi:hypothetical protein